MKFKKELAENTGNYIKLKDKESIVGIFRGEPHEFYIKWTEGKSQHVASGTAGAKLRFSCNFLVKEGTAYVAKIFEGGSQVYKQMADINDEYPLEETPVKITRNGTGLETEYSVMPMLKQAPTKEVLAYLETMKLHNLGEPSASPPAFDSNEELPF